MTELKSIEGLTQWLRRQPADGEYVWQDPVFCLMGRYLADHGHNWGEFAYSEMPEYEAIAAAKPWTYGAALARAEQLALPKPVAQPLALPDEIVVEQPVAIPAAALPAPARQKELAG